MEYRYIHITTMIDNDLIYSTIIQLQSAIDEIKRSLDQLKEELPENFRDLRISDDGAIEEVVHTTEPLQLDDY